MHCHSLSSALSLGREDFGFFLVLGLLLRFGVFVELIRDVIELSSYLES
jgi:hypothetical protein